MKMKKKDLFKIASMFSSFWSPWWSLQAGFEDARWLVNHFFFAFFCEMRESFLTHSSTGNRMLMRPDFFRKIICCFLTKVWFGPKWLTRTGKLTEKTRKLPISTSNFSVDFGGYRILVDFKIIFLQRLHVVWIHCKPLYEGVVQNLAN